MADRAISVTRVLDPSIQWLLAGGRISDGPQVGVQPGRSTFRSTETRVRNNRAEGMMVVMVARCFSGTTSMVRLQ